MGSTYNHLGEKKKERKNTSEGEKENKRNWRDRALNVSWTPTLSPLNTETQRIELTCIYRKLSLKTIYKSDGERDRPLISGTTTVGSNNNHTANAPRATTRATIDSFVAVQTVVSRWKWLEVFRKWLVLLVILSIHSQSRTNIFWTIRIYAK